MKFSVLKFQFPIPEKILSSRSSSRKNERSHQVYNSFRGFLPPVEMTNKSHEGFTLIELIIVFSLIALLSVTGIASFSTFTQRQVLGNTASDLRTMLNVARTNTLSQYNSACTSSQQFGGYLVVVCCRSSNDPTSPLNETPTAYCPNVGCSGSYDYELYESCINGNGTTTNSFVDGRLLPKGVVISRQTTARMFQFTPVTSKVTYGTQGNAISSGTVEFYLQADRGVTKSTTVTDIGSIQ